MIPPHFTCEDDGKLPHLCGLGFTDLGTGIPGTKSGAFKPTVLHSWRASFYERIKAHAARSGAPPSIIAFTGKRQFQVGRFLVGGWTHISVLLVYKPNRTLPQQELLFDYGTKPTVDFGLQTVRPEGFPFSPEETQLFVLTSSSGAAAMSNEVRLAPYQELAKLVAAIPWEPE